MPLSSSLLEEEPSQAIVPHHHIHHITSPAYLPSARYKYVHRIYLSRRTRLFWSRRSSRGSGQDSTNYVICLGGRFVSLLVSSQSDPRQRHHPSSGLLHLNYYTLRNNVGKQVRLGSPLVARDTFQVPRLFLANQFLPNICRRLLSPPLPPSFTTRS